MLISLWNIRLFIFLNPEELFWHLSIGSWNRFGANFHSALSEYRSPRHCSPQLGVRNVQRIKTFAVTDDNSYFFRPAERISHPPVEIFILNTNYASAVSSSTSTASLRLLVPSNPSTRSMGRGNTTVWFFSVLMQLRVWKRGEIGLAMFSSRDSFVIFARTLILSFNESLCRRSLSSFCHLCFSRSFFHQYGTL